jgi:curved DNA-binding protein
LAKKDYYRILNIDAKASVKQIKSAYRQMALKYHPDHNPGNEDAAIQFAKIKEAYDTLTTPELRRNYDAQYSPSPPPRAKVEPQTSPVPEPRGNGRGKNLRYNLYITLEDVANGCERGIRYMRSNGGEKETLQIKVRVPQGAFHHQRLKLAGYGDVTPDGTGDLFVIVHLQNHPIFLRNELNLRVNVPIRYIDAALGSSIDIPTLSGVRKLKLKVCEFDDLEYVLRGFGLPDAKGGYKGDLVVHCFIEHPKRLSTHERQSMEKGLRTWPQGEMMQQYQVYLKEQKGRKH